MTSGKQKPGVQSSKGVGGRPSKPAFLGENDYATGSQPKEFVFLSPPAPRNDCVGRAPSDRDWDSDWAVQDALAKGAIGERRTMPPTEMRRKCSASILDRRMAGALPRREDSPTSCTTQQLADCFDTGCPDSTWEAQFYARFPLRWRITEFAPDFADQRNTRERSLALGMKMLARAGRGHGWGRDGRVPANLRPGLPRPKGWPLLS